ncbi:synapse differentiation-inducing gene protein 1-like [Heteronotia binoei]|uniref:synapse differentiation-inducing gene protein 1-like n=1 Tax=Heteronotia binoei TaxID=13085 RepID=UPI00292D1778|nr:synapse differentiation-inducing gene protein 1-like [Heteronotia binoei]
MENFNYEKLQEETPPTQDPPPYSDKEQQPPVDGPGPAMPQQYQPYYTPYGGASNQGPIVQPPQHTTIIVPVQPTYEPDYLAYSIFTMLCCCLPLGIAALVYSVQTRDANLIGDGVAARQSSRMARILAHTALGIGLVFSIAYIVVMVVEI